MTQQIQQQQNPTSTSTCGSNVIISIIFVRFVVVGAPKILKL